MKTTIQSKNLSSIMIYTGASNIDAASYLANREYGSYVSNLGYLGRTNDLMSYWSNYSDLLYEETEHQFDNIKEIYDEGQSYMIAHTDMFANNGLVTISELVGNDKVVSRYHAHYSYQDSLDNQFSNIVPYATEDLNDFLFALNYQKYNKDVMYGNEYELNSVRIGAKTFNWHVASDIAYTTVYVDSTELSYFFAYIIDDENKPTYFYTETEYLEGSFPGQSYSYTYNYTDDVYTYDHYYYGKDGFYAYIAKEYVPVDETLNDTILEQVNEFAERHGNNEELYTYYMYDCNIDIPMTLTTKSLGVKKSTFEIRCSSIYDHWFDNVIPLNVNLNGTSSFSVVAYETAAFGVRINENESLISDVIIEKDKSSTIEFECNSSDTSYLSILSPYNMKALDISNVAQYIDGTLNITYNPWTTQHGNHLESLTIGSENLNTNITKIMGINDLVNLNYLDISNISNLVSTPAISRLSKLSTFKAKGSNIKSFKPAVGAEFAKIELPNTITSIRLQDVSIYNDNFDYQLNDNLHSVAFDNVRYFDTYKFVYDWNEMLKQSAKPVTEKLIYLELNEINWNKVPVTVMEDIKKFDLKIGNAQINVLGTSIYGMLSREEYIKMTKLYGVNAFYNASTSEKVFKNLKLNKYVNSLPKYEYTFTIQVEGKTDTLTANFDNTDNPNTIIAVNAIIDNLINVNNQTGEIGSVTLPFIYDMHEKYIYHKFSTPVDMKDTIKQSSNNSLGYGDIVLYNSDTLIIAMQRMNDVKFQYIKLGNVADTRMQLPYWFDTTIKNITFQQEQKPKTANRIVVKENGEEIDNIVKYEDALREGIDIIVEVDEPEAEITTINVVNTSTNIIVTKGDDEETQNIYNIKLNNNVSIPLFGQSEFVITFELNGNIPGTTIRLNNIVYKELHIIAKSSSDIHAYMDSNILVIDEDNATFDESTGLLELLDGTVMFDEDNGILTIE